MLPLERDIAAGRVEHALVLRFRFAALSRRFLAAQHHPQFHAAIQVLAHATIPIRRILRGRLLRFFFRLGLLAASFSRSAHPPCHRSRHAARRLLRLGHDALLEHDVVIQVEVVPRLRGSGHRRGRLRGLEILVVVPPVAQRHGTVHRRGNALAVRLLHGAGVEEEVARVDDLLLHLRRHLLPAQIQRLHLRRLPVECVADFLPLVGDPCLLRLHAFLSYAVLAGRRLRRCAAGGFAPIVFRIDLRCFLDRLFQTVKILRRALAHRDARERREAHGGKRLRLLEHALQLFRAVHCGEDRLHIPASLP